MRTYDPENQESRSRTYSLPWEPSPRGRGRRKIQLTEALFQSPRLDIGETDAPQHSFRRYFQLGSVQRLRRHIHSNAVLRNRILFILLNLGLVLYVLIHLLRGA